jgi:hypothetical protein
MNEIILAPCDVISKIKQNYSDMNEIILAPCDAGYVQSCTGFICYCIFRVYYVTGIKNPDISQEGTFRISKLVTDFGYPAQSM